MRTLMPVGAGLILVALALGSWAWAAWLAGLVVVGAAVAIIASASRGGAIREDGGRPPSPAEEMCRR